MLYGRETEGERIASLLDAARGGAGGVLVVSGAPGVGKSALLAQAVEEAADLSVLRVRGLESEAPLAFAALERLLHPVMPFAAQLPPPQAQALRVAFGRETGEAPDRFLVFLGALSLLAEAAEVRPVLAVVDDAHWLDEASTAALLFVSRRLQQERVAVLFAARDDDVHRFEGDDLPRLQLSGLDLRASQRLLRDAAGTEVGTEVTAQLVASTGGNPLALLELPRVLKPEQLSGRAVLPGRLPVTETLERVFLDRARRLSPAGQLLLLVAAADDSGSLPVIAAAATTLQTGADALTEVERSGLVQVTGGLLQFRHPLVRSAVYVAATDPERRAAHGALADALVSPEDQDRRAWHRAAATAVPDPNVVAELADAASRASSRGGHEAAAAAWERAAELADTPALIGQYRYAAANSAWLAGQIDRARHAVDLARAAALDDSLLAADTAQLRARIEWNTGSVPLAHRTLLEAAAAVCRHDTHRARRLAMFAAAVATVGGHSGVSIDALQFATADAQDDPPSHGRCLTELITGLVQVTEGDISLAAPHLQAALRAGEHAGVDDYDVLPNLGVAALHLGDLDAYAAIHEQMLSRGREEGALVVVLYALTRLAFSDVASGRWATAIARQTEAVHLGTATQQPVLGGAPRAALLLLSALRADPGYEQQLHDLRSVIDGPPVGVLGNLLRDHVRWAQAVHAFPRSAAGFHHLAQMTVDITRRQAGLDRIEAAVHSDQRELAFAWTEDLEQFATFTGASWAAAMAAHGHALLAAPRDADDHFEAALDHQRHGSRPFDRARTEFAYGEHLRRTRRRVAAREHLRNALDVFDDLQAIPWSERAKTELRASGESIRKREAPTSTTLTPQELQVAQLVQRGLSNRDAAARLFVSPRTVDFHLRNIFTKTGIGSRTELAQLTLS